MEIDLTPSKGKFGESKVPTKMQSQSMQKNVPTQLFEFLDKCAKDSAIGSWSIYRLPLRFPRLTLTNGYG